MPFGDIVPLKFQQLSGFDRHLFAVRSAWHRPYRYRWASRGVAESIPDAAFCEVRDKNAFLPCLMPRSAASEVFEAVLLYSATFNATTRVEKYLTPYRALECLQPQPPLEFRAIRHTLANSTSHLRDPSVLEALHRLFGGVTIDFRRYAHQREFYRSLGLLLTVLDHELQHALLSRRALWLPLEDSETLLKPNEENALGLSGAG